VAEVRRVLLAHLDDLYTFYGERTGVSLARKHIGWYTRGLPDSAAFRHRVFQIPTVAEQRAAVDRFFDTIRSIA
jgi:tRNA-dihydrouridine synthase B